MSIRLKKNGGLILTKKKKLVKQALKQPDLYSPAELQYFKIWLASKKAAKKKAAA